MPPGLGTPVLSVDAGKMRSIDMRNMENLFGMWSGKHEANCSSPPGLRILILRVQQSSPSAPIQWKMAND